MSLVMIVAVVARPGFVRPRPLSQPWARDSSGTGPARNNDPRSAYRASIRQAALPHLSIRSGKPKAEAQIHPIIRGPAGAAGSPGVNGEPPGGTAPKGS